GSRTQSSLLVFGENPQLSRTCSKHWEASKYFPSANSFFARPKEAWTVVGVYGVGDRLASRLTSYGGGVFSRLRLRGDRASKSMVSNTILCEFETLTVLRLVLWIQYRRSIYHELWCCCEKLEWKLQKAKRWKTTYLAV